MANPTGGSKFSPKPKAAAPTPTPAPKSTPAAKDIPGRKAPTPPKTAPTSPQPAPRPQKPQSAKNLPGRRRPNLGPEADVPESTTAGQPPKNTVEKSPKASEKLDGLKKAIGKQAGVPGGGEIPSSKKEAAKMGIETAANSNPYSAAALQAAKVAGKVGSRAKKTATNTKNKAMSLSGLGDSKGGGGGKKPPAKNQKATGSSGSASGTVTATVKKHKWLILGISLLTAMILGFASMAALIGSSTGANHYATGPTSEEDINKIKDCIPAEYLDILQQSADQTSRDKPPGNIPWTMLAGILMQQTVFGKKSPYDNIERYKSLKIADSCTASAGGTTTGSPNGPDPWSGSDSSPAAPGEIPARFLGMVLRAGAVCPEIKPWMLAGKFTQESNWNPRAGSPTGAHGLAQFLDSTWSSGGYDFNGDGVADIWNPYDAIWSAAHYSCSFVEMFKKKAQEDPAKWNKGPDTIAKAAIQAYHDGPAYQLANGPGVDLNANGQEAVTYVPGVWSKGQALLKRYPQLANADANAALPQSDPDLGRGPYATVENPRKASGGGTVGSGTCSIPTDSNPIGGSNETQGVGPYLLSPGAANEARAAGYDPQSPCVSDWITSELSKKAVQMDADGESAGFPPFFKDAAYDKNNPDAMKQYKANQVFWAAVIQQSGLFVDKNSNADSCSLVTVGQPESDDKAAQQYLSEIMHTFHCEIAGEYNLYTVSSLSNPGGPGSTPTFSLMPDRAAQESAIIKETANLSYAATKWKKDFPCEAQAATPQGLIPLTKEEFLSAGYDNPAERCDSSASVRAAAILFVKGEKVPVNQRPTDSPYEPMLGGWANISYALSQDKEPFMNMGPAVAPSSGGSCYSQVGTFVEDVVRNPQAGKKFADAVAGANGNPAKLQAGEAVIAGANIKPLSQRQGCESTPSQTLSESIGQYVASREGSAQGDVAKAYHEMTNWGLAMRDGAAKPPAIPGKTALVPRISPTDYAFIEYPANVQPINTVAVDLGMSTGQQGSAASTSQKIVEWTTYYGGTGQPGTPSTAGIKTGSLADGDNDPFQNVQSAGGGQTSVNPGQCPAAGYVPPRAEKSIVGLPKGKDLHSLCEDSVKQAPTPEAAKAIMWMMDKIGKWQYTMSSDRNAVGWADCSSYIARGYMETSGLDMQSGGNAWATPSFNDRQTPKIAVKDIKPGDVLVNSHHIVMAVAWGLVMHIYTYPDPPSITAPNFTPGATYQSMADGVGDDPYTPRRIDPTKFDKVKNWDANKKPTNAG